MTSKVVLLYEDKAVGPAKGYGPHKLVVQCLCDALGVEPWRMGDIVEGIPGRDMPTSARTAGTIP